MKQYYKVTFRWYGTDIWCANIAHATTPEAVKAHYGRKECTRSEIMVSECPAYDLDTAREKGMPIVEVE